ncbi:MAG: prepilin-type N-terminal cleavage/methylation domain-containing protein [Planctomycetes bacterium]|nr:prepilin-type N-terminal cleavage/methylation domain-containing protein [Planctomycetota bacterium]
MAGKRAPAAVRGAFTLAELLVVIAILAAIGGMAFPCLRMAVRAAIACSCRNNLRQVGIAALLYADDWNQCLPAKGNLGVEDPDRSPAWFCRLPAYCDSDNVLQRVRIFQCAGFSWHGPTLFTNATPKSFKMNAYLDGGGRPANYVLGSAPDESEMVLFVDAVARETGMGQWGHAVFSAIDDSRHPGRVNVLYCDGHASATIMSPKNRDWKHAMKWTSERWVKPRE